MIKAGATVLVAGSAIFGRGGAGRSRLLSWPVAPRKALPGML